MRRLIRTAPAVLSASLYLMASSCGTSTTSPGGAPATTSAPAAGLKGPLTVFAAASLTGAFDSEKTTIERVNPGLSLSYSFGGSGVLVQQIVQGAPADVFAAADLNSMKKLESAGLVDAPQVFANNKLEIAVTLGNPKHIRSLADLANPRLAVVIEDPSQPAGRYTQQVLSKLGVTVHPKSMPLDVKSTLETVLSGDADAAVVYASDLRTVNSLVTGVPIPASQNVTAVYPIAVIKATKNRMAAEAFVHQIVAGTGQKALAGAGFLPPNVKS